jgi:large subunit ribosomal protein L10
MAAGPSTDIKPVREEKAAAVADLVDRFRSSTATVLTEYRGLTVSDITKLRRSLGGETRYRVAKNTFIKKAAAEAGIEGLDHLFSGPTALAFITGDPVEAAKSLRDFAREHPALVVKGGVMEGKTLSAEEITRLADLESREVLLAKLAGAMKAKTSQAAALFQAPLSQMVRLVAALQEKRESGDAEASDAEVAAEA